MQWIILFGATLLLLGSVTQGKPVAQKPSPPSPDENTVEGDSEDDQGTNLPYDKYLREVVMALEEDPEFRKRLEESNVSDIKDGSVAKHIELVSHQVRTKLDEIKRREIYRLQELRRAQMKSMQGVGNIELPPHLDVDNPHSFEMKDLEKLIKQTTTDLEQLDEQRKKEFKEYEMEKEFERQDKLKHMDEVERKKEEAKLEELKKKHADHPKINHPGSKDQFEEVWEKKDHLEDQEFNPKTFFHLHDIEGDGFWGIEEVEAVLQSELDKVYDGNNPEDDPMERFEEMNRMREHIFTEIDKDKDARISLQEFLSYTGQHGENEEFKKDEGWKTLDENELYTDEEYQRFLQEHHAQPGEVNIPPGGHIDPNVLQMQMQQMQQGQQMPSGSPQNLQFQPQQGMHDFQQQQNQFAQQQQVLQHQQQQFAQQQAMQQQMAQQHAQMQQHIQQQQQQHIAQQVNQPGQGQLPVQGQGQAQQVQGQVPVQSQQVQGQGQPAQAQVPAATQIPVQNQQAQQQQQQQVPVQQQQQQVPVQQQQQQVPVQQQQQQVPVQQQQQEVPVQQQQQQAQPTH